MHLALVDLAFVTLADNKNAVFEYGQPEITNVKDFLSCSITRHMTTTCPRVEIIENSFNFHNCEALVKNIMDTDMV